MKFIKTLFLFLFFSLSTFIHPEIKFEPIALDENNNFLFNSLEIIGNKDAAKTLYYGKLDKDKIDFQTLTFYPEKLYYSQSSKKIFIHNRIGLYEYDFGNKSIKSIENYPNFANKDEYSVFKPSEIVFSPDFSYFIAKIETTNIKSSIFLFDLKQNISTEIIKDVDIKPGKKSGIWSFDSNFFIYEKNNRIYYFSITDFLRKKVLAEDWREIGKAGLYNAQWTKDNFLYWIEKNYIYKADSNQFFSRSIYRSYLRQGNIVRKIPFSFDPSFDSFYVNDDAKKIVIVKNKNIIFYYSLTGEINENLYLELGENKEIEECSILNNGQALILINKLENGKIIKEILFIKKENNHFTFKPFDLNKINNAAVGKYVLSNDLTKFVIASDKGAFCFNFDLVKLWSYEKEKIINAVNTEADEWIIGGENTVFKFTPKDNGFLPLFAGSFLKAGFTKNKIFVSLKSGNYTIEKDKFTLIPAYSDEIIDNTALSNSKYRLLSRKINKGFYSEVIFLKELYSGKYFDIIGEPKLKYSLYQPELKIGAGYYNSPLKEKYEVALVFNCTKSAEGVVEILTKLNDFKINATFFINGTFMEINPALTREISNFSFEIGNIFQYDINLTDSNFLIDKNFVRQGLSINEERYYKITGKNFNPIWHSPGYAFNDTIIKFGKESGYSFVSYNLDSMDWAGTTNTELNKSLVMKNSELVERILKNIRPGYIIVFNAGKNESVRDEWLFQELELLISELIRAGYSFTTATDILKKYRD